MKTIDASHWFSISADSTYQLALPVMPHPSEQDGERQSLLRGLKVNDIKHNYRDQEEALLCRPDTIIPFDPSNWECLKVMIGVWLGTLLAALDTTIVATLSVAISDSFDSLSLISWVISAYLIANAAVQPISGKLTDIYGRRAGFLLAILFFSVGNIICALAEKSWVMILGRLVAGAGGGCLNTISTFIGSDMIPLRKRGLWHGIGNFNYGVRNPSNTEISTDQTPDRSCVWRSHRRFHQ